ncbi:MAG: nuclear transport factor 2 family protein [Actinomycetes bacterium]
MSGFQLSGLLNLERRGWDSLTRSQGGDFYGRLMTEDAVMVLVNGMVLDRDTVAGPLNDSPPWETYALTDERLVPVSDDVAALLYRATATRAGEDEPFLALMTSVYRMVDGEPRLALYQQTTITH